MNINIIHNHSDCNQGYYKIDTDEIIKMPDKECCIVCGIIVCYNFVFIGLMIGLIQSEDLNLNSTIF
jgi:hypothetical protein